MTELKSLTAERLKEIDRIREYQKDRAPETSISEAFDDLLREVHRLRRLQPEGRSSELLAKELSDHMHKIWSEHRGEYSLSYEHVLTIVNKHLAVAHSSSAGPSEPRCPKCGSGRIGFYGADEPYKGHVECAEPQCDFELFPNSLADFAQFFPASRQVREYVHWPWCNGSRQYPAGEPGHSCSCFNAKHGEVLAALSATPAPLQDLKEIALEYEDSQSPTAFSDAIQAAYALGKKHSSPGQTLPECPCGLPPQLKQAISDWLTSNKKTHYEVRYGGFPLGMVQGWIERVKDAEKKLKRADLEIEALNKEIEPAGQTNVPQMGQPAIDISNLLFYSRMANEFEWHTDIIHKSVIAHTLQEIAARLLARGPQMGIAEQWVSVLLAIEEMAGDDFCEDLAMCNASRKLRGRIATAHEKLSRIYRLAHAFNPQHTCHHVHENWREELKEYQEPGPAAPAQPAHFVQTPVEGNPSCHVCGKPMHLCPLKLGGKSHYECKACGATTGVGPAQPANQEEEG